MTGSRTGRDALIGLVYVLLVAALVTLSIIAYNDGFSDDIEASVKVDNAGTSMQKGSDVKIRGVLIGRVTAVRTEGDGVTLAVALDPTLSRKVPADVTARLLPKTLFGERYVSLVEPADDPGPAIASGDVIRQDTSAEGVELQQLFDSVLPVLQAVQPAQLATVLGTIAQTVRGRGGQIGDTVTTLVAYLREFAPQVPTVLNDLDQLASVAQTYSGAAPDLVDALDSFTTTTQTVISQRDSFLSTYATAITAANSADGFLGANQGSIITLSADSVPILTTLAQYSGEFPCVAQALRDFVPTADAALGADQPSGGLRVNLRVVPSPGKYVAGVDNPTGAVPAGGPSCPVVAGSGIAAGVLPSILGNSAIPGNPAIPGNAAGTGATTPALDPTLSPALRAYLASGEAAGLGPQNSPQENEVIAELVAPTLGMAPSRFPDWGSLLLGPVLRGTQVDLQTGSGEGS